MRQLVLSPRWMMWHLLTIGAMVTCGLLAAWQWSRAGSAFGTALNVGYGLQWPAFALFFGVMWWRMLSMEMRQLRGEDVGPRWDDEEPAPAAPVVTAPVDDGPSPFGPRPRSAAPRVSAEDDPEMAEYNRMLADLAARERST